MHGMYGMCTLDMACVVSSYVWYVQRVCMACMYGVDVRRSTTCMYVRMSICIYVRMSVWVNLFMYRYVCFCMLGFMI